MVQPVRSVGAPGPGAGTPTLAPTADPPSDAAPPVTGRVAFQGEPGAFAEDAARAFFGPAADAVAVPSWRDVFERVERGEAAAGVVPIENLVNGTVRETYDLLLEHRLEIVGEVVVPVRLCLAALPGETLDSIERVYSHLQALGQADAFLRRRSWALMTTYNTAGAGKLIAERGERGAAAVLSPRAAALFGLEVLADGIQTVPDNRTRFLIVAQPPATAASRDSAAAAMRTTVVRLWRTTLVFALPNEPGALYRALGIFANAGLNMSYLESRPSRGRAWEYVFWVDLDADARQPAVRHVLDGLAASLPLVRVLGTYPRAADL